MNSRTGSFNPRSNPKNLCTFAHCFTTDLQVGLFRRDGRRVRAELRSTDKCVPLRSGGRLKRTICKSL